MLTLLVRGPHFENHCSGLILPLEVPSPGFLHQGWSFLEPLPISCVMLYQKLLPSASLPSYDVWAVAGRLYLSATALVPSPVVSQSKHREGTSPFHLHRPGELTRTSGSLMRTFPYGSLCWICPESWVFSSSSYMFSTFFWWPGKAKGNTQPQNLQAKEPAAETSFGHSV